MKSGTILVSQPDRSYRITLASTIALVNLVSLTGLIIWTHKELAFWPIVVMLSLALESISVFLQHLAYHAEIKLISAFRLKAASKTYAAFTGYLNADGFRVNGHLTKISIAIALISASGPWLWGAFARQISYTRLVQAGALEGRALKLGATRWFYHPIRSWRIMWISTWKWETNPSRAVEEYEARRTEKRELGLLDKQVQLVTDYQQERSH